MRILILLFVLVLNTLTLCAQDYPLSKTFVQGDIMVFRTPIFDKEAKNYNILISDEERKRLTYTALISRQDLQFWYVSDYLIKHEYNLEQGLGFKILEINPFFIEGEFEFKIEIVGPPGSPKLMRT